MPLIVKRRSILPGFGPALGFTLLYLSLIVLIPLSAAFFKTAALGWEGFWRTATEPRVMASYRLTFGAAFAGATINAVFGFLVAWVLVRYTFPGKRLVDALVDLPFALPTAVAGIALTTVYSSRGWFGAPLEAIGIKAAYSRLGFGSPVRFMVLRCVAPPVRRVWKARKGEVEGAAASWGASRPQTFARV